MRKYDLHKLLAQSLPNELCSMITSYIVQSDIRKEKEHDESYYVYYPRVRHRYLFDSFKLDIDLD